MKERVLAKDEVVFCDGTQADYIYLLVKGRLRVEKEVEVSSVNHWPEDVQVDNQLLKKTQWTERKIQNHVLYKVNEIEPFSLIGEKECIKNL